LFYNFTAFATVLPQIINNIYEATRITFTKPGPSPMPRFIFFRAGDYRHGSMEFKRRIIQMGDMSGISFQDGGMDELYT